VLGTASETVSIPGRLLVENNINGVTTFQHAQSPDGVYYYNIGTLSTSNAAVQQTNISGVVGDINTWYANNCHFNLNFGANYSQLNAIVSSVIFNGVKPANIQLLVYGTGPWTFYLKGNDWFNFSLTINSPAGGFTPNPNWQSSQSLTAPTGTATYDLFDRNYQVLTTAGNVGIGTTNPTKMLTVAGDALINGLTVGKGGNSVWTNTAFGSNALNSNNATGLYNTAFGGNALSSNTTGGSNTAFGFNSLLRNTTAAYNVAVGGAALEFNVTGDNNTAVGLMALYSNTAGSANTAVGQNALKSNTASSNSAFGQAALTANTTGYNNTALGLNALLTNIDGNNNTGVGLFALKENTGHNNSASGCYALQRNTSGAHNTALGYEAGASGTANTIGSQNTYLGYNTGANANNWSNSTAIGAGSRITASNQIVLGTASEKVVIPNQIQYSYTSVPTLTSTSIGYTITGTRSAVNPITISPQTLLTADIPGAGVWMVCGSLLAYGATVTAWNNELCCFLYNGATMVRASKHVLSLNQVSVASPTLTYVLSTSTATTLTLRAQISMGTASIGGSDELYLTATRIA
jgi:hypothetical protein